MVKEENEHKGIKVSKSSIFALKYKNKLKDQIKKN